MTTNAPYYQVRGQFTSGGANAHFVPDDVDDYDLSASVTPHDAALYTDRQPSETPIATLEENHNFVELLEAATTAAGQGALAMNVDTGGGGMTMPSKGKRKRVSSPPADDSTNSLAGLEQGHIASGPKRARIDVPTDPQLHGAEGDMRGRSESSSMPPSGESLLNDARAAGVHSAAALFRRSSEKPSRKYTRPPMSKLFMSLQLTPENFLHLQAQAKAYMLDPAHPERQNCVGNRAKGDTDMVKLRLFNCVRDFLNSGAGEEFFGEHVEKPGEKDAIEAARALGEEKAASADKLVWPRDGNKIISLVTPLMRRMVTNERQRMYAIETRKGGTKKKEASVEATDHSSLEAANRPGQQNERPQISVNTTNINSLAPYQSQIQHSQPAPASSLSVHFSTNNQTMPSFGASQEQHELSPPQKLELPIQPPADPNLQRINIFLVVKETRGMNDIKLEPEMRITINPPELETLSRYPWVQLNNDIASLLEKAVRRYTGLEDPLGMGPEALRGLAAAATEMQNTSVPSNDDPGEKANSGVEAERNDPSGDDAASTQGLAPTPTAWSPLSSKESLAPTHAGIQPPSAVLPLRLLPPYKIKTMWSKGWKYVESGLDWQYVLLDVGFSVWADGTLTVLVELERA